ncbi:hypothetical protein ACFQDF_23155 [Ectobacillus funiculus]
MSVIVKKSGQGPMPIKLRIQNCPKTKISQVAQFYRFIDYHQTISPLLGTYLVKMRILGNDKG